MTSLTQQTTPPSPRFNAWRLAALVIVMLFVVAIPLEIIFYIQLRESKINLAEVVFLDERDAIRKAFELKKQIETMRTDSARMATKIGYLERQQKPTKATNAKTTIYLIPVFAKTPKDYKTFNDYVVAKMQHYVLHANKLYKAAGIDHKLK